MDEPTETLNTKYAHQGPKIKREKNQIKQQILGGNELFKKKTFAFLPKNGKGGFSSNFYVLQGPPSDPNLDRFPTSH